MADSVSENMRLILGFLAAPKRAPGARASMTGQQIQEALGLSTAQVYDAVTLLVENGLVEWYRPRGTATFESVEITPRGRYELEVNNRLGDGRGLGDGRDTSLVVPPGSLLGLLPTTPVGSPYGFTDDDWELVSKRKHDPNTCFVVLGYQWKSEHYDSDLLRRNIESMFAKAVEAFNRGTPGANVALGFEALAAEYGEHLFNNIARAIIASDIAIFETSNLNPNVMLEMGVALTWGVRVLPIKALDLPSPPSDISGQTWAEYESSGSRFIGDDHDEKLLRMVERAVRKKAGRRGGGA